jgi:putative colanic acid biosysnthesis UDP-glucose lipid carrier transferase
MILRYQYLLRKIFFTYDMLLLNIGYVISTGIVYLLDPFRYPINLFISYFFLFNVIWISLSYLLGFYSTPLSFIPLTRNTIRLLFYHFALFIASNFFLKNQDFSRLQIVIHYLTISVFLLAGRYLFHILQSSFGILKFDKRKVVIVGDDEKAMETAKYLKRHDSGYELLGFFCHKDSPSSATGLPVLGTPENCVSFAKENGVQEIYSTLFSDSAKELRKMVTDAEESMIRIKFIPNYETIFKRNVSIQLYEGLSVISFRDEPLELMENRVTKRLFDIGCTVFLLLTVFWWLFPLLALIIKMTSKGPVFFSQARSGRNGETFYCYKFRSMYVNKDADTKAAEQNDRRITAFGKFMRKTNLDELPQFINVLKGDMSIVGPRPHMLNHTEEYRQIIRSFMVRHLLKPGITGWAQVNGLRGNISEDMMQKRVEYDIWYLENWSFFLDIKIMVKTVLNVFKGEENAY